MSICTNTVATKLHHEVYADSVNAIDVLSRTDIPLPIQPTQNSRTSACYGWELNLGLAVSQPNTLAAQTRGLVATQGP